MRLAFNREKKILDVLWHSVAPVSHDGSQSIPFRNPCALVLI